MASETFTRCEEVARSKALAYLKAKFPHADERAFFTDYTGTVHEAPIRLWAVVQASEIDNVCASCTGTCTLPGPLKAKNSRPVISLAQSSRGYSFLDVRRMCGFGCKYQQTLEFERLFRKSGLKEFNRHMTFTAYECQKSDTETRKARLEAMKASENGTCLIPRRSSRDWQDALSHSNSPPNDGAWAASYFPSCERNAGRDTGHNPRQWRL
ncbi:MAG: hypothetical protein II954_05080 [Synergistaceae bacterium]|nr:hypothetical protein [Synergistaceae bacterium]